MTRYLIAATPVHGHVMPMLAIAKGLTGRGHHVRVLTGSRFASAAAAAGADHVPLPPPADYDDRDPDAAFPQRRELTGLARLRFDMDNIFINPIPTQAAAADRAARRPEPTRSSPTPRSSARSHLLLRPRTHRPTVGVCGVFPLSVSSRDTAPFGLGLPPSSTRVGRARNQSAQPAHAACGLRRVPAELSTSHRRSRPARAGDVLPGRPPAAGRPIPPVDRSRLRVPAERPATLGRVRRTGPPGRERHCPAARLVGRPRRTHGCPRHAGHHRQPGPVQPDRSDPSRARRRGRPDRRSHRRTTDRIDPWPTARQCPGRRVHPLRPPPPAGGRDGHQRGIRRSPIRARPRRTARRRRRKRRQTRGGRPGSLVRHRHQPPHRATHATRHPGSRQVRPPGFQLSAARRRTTRRHGPVPTTGHHREQPGWRCEGVRA